MNISKMESEEMAQRRIEANKLRNRTCKETNCKNLRQPGSSRCKEHARK